MVACNSSYAPYSYEFVCVIAVVCMGRTWERALARQDGCNVRW